MTNPTFGTSWSSYPSVFALGHKAVQDIFLDPVLCQVKVDGSQISFGVIEGELRMRSIAWGWPQVRRGLTRGMPLWWKEELLKKQFDAPAS